MKASLSRRQTEVLHLCLQGLQNSEIGNKLCLTVNTVRCYLAIIYEKLGCASREELLVWAALQMDDEERRVLCGTATAKMFLRGLSQLTAEELETLDCLVLYPGMSHAQLGLHLAVKGQRVKSRLTQIKAKCGLSGRHARALLGVWRIITRELAPEA